MKWPSLLAVLALAALPTPARAQTAKELLDAHAKATASKRLDPYDMNDLTAYRNAGWRAIVKGYYDTAEHEFAAAIKAAKRPGLDEPWLTARSYADYAWALQKQGRNAEAEPLLKWALLARESSPDPAGSAVAQGLNQLATLYYDLGRFAEAEPLLRRAIDSQAKASRASPLEQARSRTLMGLLDSAQRRYAEAEPHFAAAVALRESALGPSHPETGDGLSNLAWSCHEQGKDDQALPLFERSRRIFERSRGVSDPSVAHALNGRGQILARQGKPTEAEADFVRAIDILGPKPYEEPSLLEVLRHYADLLEDQGRAADLGKIKARLAPLRAKYTPTRSQPAVWYRAPEPSPSPASTPARQPG